jgi:peptidoglycan/xylan/chitin deacetylase (PgdA/CDA1 family)
MSTLKGRLNRSLEKNLPELKAIVDGRMPGFVTRPRASLPLDHVPTFVFHGVEAKRFESQLRYLRSSGYQTLDADDLMTVTRSKTRSKPSVALTFDDATWTFWTYAFPLLKRYGFRAVLFAVPGLVPEDSTSYPNLEDLWAGRCTHDDLAERGKVQPLCSWRELAIMHDSGIVDIQSHTLNHARVSVSSRLVDFLHPDFDRDDFGNVSIPVSSVDELECPKREFRLGAPVFEFASRMSGRPRFKENPELVETLTGYVEEHGGLDFFNRPTWRNELVAIFERWPSGALGSFENRAELETAIRWELVESCRILEQRLAKKQIRHLCYPWFEGSDTADRLAIEAGFQTLHYGLEVGVRRHSSSITIRRVCRISEEYLFRLPGEGRHTFLSIWKDRLRHFKNGGGH